MVEEITATLRHAVFKTYEFERGKPPSIDTNNDRLTKLLKNGDQMLDRKKGFFFDTIDGNLVVVFQQLRKDEHSRGSSMRYFDVFSTPVEDVIDVRLSALVDLLRANRVPSYAAVMEDRVQINSVTLDIPRLSSVETVQRETEKEGETTEVGTTTDSDEDEKFTDIDKIESSDSTSDSESREADTDTTFEKTEYPFDAEFIADFWERYNRDDLKIYGNLETVDRFRYYVDETLPEISFVSAERLEGDFFDIVGESGVQTERKTRMTPLIRELHANECLSFGELPGYDELAAAKKDEFVDQLPGVEDVMSHVDDQLEKLRDEIEASIEETIEERNQVIDDIYVGNVPTDNANDSRLPNRITSSLKGVVGTDNERHPLVKQLESEKIREEAAEYAVRRLSQETVKGGLTDRQDEISDIFNEFLASQAEYLRETAAKQTIRTVLRVRRTDEYQRANPEEDWND